MIAAEPAPLASALPLRRWLSRFLPIGTSEAVLDPDLLTDHLRRDLGFTDGPARPLRDSDW